MGAGRPLFGPSSPPFDPLAQLAEQLPFKQWVWSSNLQRVTSSEIPTTAPFPPCGENCAMVGVSSLSGQSRQAPPRGGRRLRKFPPLLRFRRAVETALWWGFLCSQGGGEGGSTDDWAPWPRLWSCRRFLVGYSGFYGADAGWPRTAERKRWCSGRKSCTTGPTRKAAATVPMPTVPPRSQPVRIKRRSQTTRTVRN